MKETGKCLTSVDKKFHALTIFNNNKLFPAFGHFFKFNFQVNYRIELI